MDLSACSLANEPQFIGFYWKLDAPFDCWFLTLFCCFFLSRSRTSESDFFMLKRRKLALNSMALITFCLWADNPEKFPWKVAWKSSLILEKRRSKMLNWVAKSVSWFKILVL